MAEETKMQDVELHRDAELERSSEFENPGLPPHRKRQTDLHPEKEKRAERVVFTWFLLSALGSILAVAAYVAVPITPGDLTSTRFNNLFLGLGIALALLAIGIGAVHWSKQLMSDEEHVELPGRDARVHVVPLGHVARVDGRRRDPGALGRGHLVAHERQQRRDDDRRPETLLA